MKLFTEEQVREAFDNGYKYASTLRPTSIGEHYKYVENSIKSLIPIELPSDEEIEDKGKWVFNDAGHTIYNHYNTVPSWVEGAKWMKEQILNQNK